MKKKEVQSHKGNILIVDDNPDNLRLLDKILVQHGYRVRPAPNGSLALSAVQKFLPDLILLDIRMPDMSGYEVCQQLKIQERTREIPVIFISALSEVFDKVKAFKLGAVDYITKPFQPKEVIARIGTHLTLRMLQQQLQEQNLLLQEQNTRFKVLENATFEGLIIHNDVQIFEVNQRFEEMLQYERGKLIGQRFLELIAPEYHDLVTQPIHAVEGLPYHAEILRGDGERLPIEILSKAMPYQGKQVQVTAIRDLSRQKAMEAERERLQQENIVLKATMKDRYRFGRMVGKSEVMQKVYATIASAAATPYHVVIYGESGTGKELVARTIHELSNRKHAHFVPVNCGAVTETLFEREFFGHSKGAFTGADRNKAGFLDLAKEGSLFLDELGELSIPMQVKLLRALDLGEYTPVGDSRSKHADIRVIAATNKDLRAEVKMGRFRLDLFYRIHVIEIHLPPLRERREDIPLLIEDFLANYQPGDVPDRLPVKVAETLYNYDWPGNVRELQNRLQHYLTTKQLNFRGIEKIDEETDGDEQESHEPLTLHEAVERLEKRMISKALHENHWHRGNTAKMLAIPRKTLQRKIKKYELK